MPSLDDSLVALAALVVGRTHPRDLPAAEWNAVIARAIDHGLAPFLLYRIQSSANAAPVVDLSALSRAAHHSAARYALHEKEHARLESLLRAANIPTLWVKGIALARTLYPDPTLRPMSDLDLLVHESDYPTAIDLLRANGYQPSHSPHNLFDTDHPLVESWTHHTRLVGGPSSAVPVEIHKRLISTDESVITTQQADWFWDHPAAFQTPLTDFQTLNPTANLLYLCAHAELQHRDLYLLRYLDLHLLIESTPLDWQGILTHASDLRWTYIVETALRRCQQLFDTSLPTDLLDQLRARRLPDEDIVLAMSLKQRGSRWVAFRRTLARLSSGDQARLILRVLFPPPSYMRLHYNLGDSQSLLLAYFRRWRDQLGEVIAALRRS